MSPSSSVLLLAKTITRGLSAIAEHLVVTGISQSHCITVKSHCITVKSHCITVTKPVFELCASEFGIEVGIIACKRLGRVQSERRRPILVVCKSADSVANVLACSYCETLLILKLNVWCLSTPL